MRRLRSLGRESRGQALLEFALLLPLLLLLVLGIVEFGRAWNLTQVISDATREGARRAVIADPTITEQSVRDQIAYRLNNAGVPTSAITITIAPAWRTGFSQTVTTEVPYRFMFFSTALSPITLKSSFTMRME